MKKNLRMLCMGLAAAATSMAFAQEPQNFTSKLWNSDFEKGPHGWDITGESGDQYYNVWMPQVKGDVKAPGYHGHNNIALEIWQGSGTLKDNSLSQTVTDLPNGTYVFGAYMMATNQSTTPNRELIEGVYMFANEEEIPVATNIVENGNVADSIWAHAGKFNVAVEVTDGRLKVGAKCVATNINFTTIDNATLWYFGNMDKAAALDKMAQIDMAASLAIADTCVGLKANAESMAYLVEKMQAAKELTSAENAWTVDEELWWGMRQVRKSAKAYQKLADAIAVAKEYAAKEWSGYDDTQAALKALNTMIGELEAGYKEGTIVAAEVDSLNAALTEAMAMLGMDEIYMSLEAYRAMVDSIGLLEGDEVGQYSSDMLGKAGQYLLDLDDAIALLGNVSALEVKTNCEALFAKIQDIIDNPISYSQFPIVTKRAETKLLADRSYTLMEGMELIDGLPSYTSPTYRFKEPLTKVRFTVLENAEKSKSGNFAYFSISTLELYDEFGDIIPLNEWDFSSNSDHNAINPGSPDGGGFAALIDGNRSTYFHSAWKNAPNEAPYIEVTLPEGQYSAFSFKLEPRSGGMEHQCPVIVDIRYVSEATSELKVIYDNALASKYRKGSTPGFYSAGVDEYNAAMAEAKRLVEADYADDSEVKAAIAALSEAIENVKKYFVLPEPGKEYRIISGEEAFMKLQSVHKALTTHQYAPYGERLWWENAHPDSLKQVFSLEPIENDENKLYYTIKSVSTGLYLGEYHGEDGEKVNNVFALSERIDTFLLKDLGDGQFGILREGHDREMFHCLDHNDGAPSSNKSGNGIEGGVNGISSSVCTWVSSAYSPSAWAFRELKKLPFEAKSVSELNFQSESISLYSGIKTVTLTADKECAFADLVITDIVGDPVSPVSVEVKGNVATVEFENVLGELFFSFTNTEGVETVVLNGRGDLPEYTALQAAYDDAVAEAVVEGPEVGQIADLKEYNTALANAEALLLNGGEVEALVAAKAAIDAAVANLKYNLPVAGQEYFIQSALPWMTRWNSEMDVFVRGDKVYWSYVNIKNMNHRWRFVDCGEPKNGMPAYYLENVGSQLYLTTPRAEDSNNSGFVYLVEEKAEAAPFNIHFLTDGKVAIADSREGNANGSWCLHTNNHANGTGYVAYGDMITWGKHDAASAMRIVSAEKVIADFMDGIEDVEIADEYVAPAKKGIYDLYGRRIETPAATGIYIVDGKKRVIKK